MEIGTKNKKIESRNINTDRKGKEQDRQEALICPPLPHLSVQSDYILPSEPQPSLQR
jgi:hypothetical protein